MTIKDIIQGVGLFARGYSEATFRRDCKRLNIEPVGNYRTIPRQYPTEAVEIILASRGFAPELPPRRLAPGDTASKQLVTAAQLKAASPKRNGRAKR